MPGSARHDCLRTVLSAESPGPGLMYSDRESVRHGGWRMPDPARCTGFPSSSATIDPGEKEKIPLAMTVISGFIVMSPFCARHPQPSQPHPVGRLFCRRAPSRRPCREGLSYRGKAGLVAGICGAFYCRTRPGAEHRLPPGGSPALPPGCRAPLLPCRDRLLPDPWIHWGGFRRISPEIFSLEFLIFSGPETPIRHEYG